MAAATAPALNVPESVTAANASTLSTALAATSISSSPESSEPKELEKKENGDLEEGEIREEEEEEEEEEEDDGKVKTVFDSKDRFNVKVSCCSVGKLLLADTFSAPLVCLLDLVL